MTVEKKSRKKPTRRAATKNAASSPATGTSRGSTNTSRRGVFPILAFGLALAGLLSRNLFGASQDFTAFLNDATAFSNLPSLWNNDNTKTTHGHHNGLPTILTTLTNHSSSDLWICDHLLQTPLAILWQEHLQDIWQASLPPRMPKYTPTNDHDNSTPQQQQQQEPLLRHLLFHTFQDTRRLRRGLRSAPFGPANLQALERILKMVQARLKALEDYKENNPDAKLPPPVRVVVLGGSVTAGRGCWPKGGLSNHECAWPRRFEYLVNQLLVSNYPHVSNQFKKKPLIKVYNMAVGGTNSKQGNDFIKYWMYPKDLREIGPDVIINSYSTNDSLPPWNLKNGTQQSLEKSVRKHLQDFVRLSLLSRPCGTPPLVIHVDDYLGFQNPESLLGELAYNTAMTQVAKWYGTMAVSYADVVRDIVYQDTDETNFSAPWIRPRKGFQVEVHFGHVAHTVIAWGLLWSILEVTSSHCADRSIQRLPQPTQLPNNNHNKQNPWNIPPLLDENLRLQDVAQTWNEGPQDDWYSTVMNVNCSSHDGTENNNSTKRDYNPCVLTWIAAPTGFFKAHALRGYMKKRLVANNGWDSLEDTKSYGWSKKLGWEPTKPNASFTLQLKDVSKDILVVTILYMKSYGPKWANSRAKFTVREEGHHADAALLSRELLGYHNSNTSITYTERLVLPKPIVKGSTLEVEVSLVEGTAFKISGMMFCSW